MGDLDGFPKLFMGTSQGNREVIAGWMGTPTGNRPIVAIYRGTELGNQLVWPPQNLGGPGGPFFPTLP